MDDGQRILEQMLDRLFAAIVNGPSLNCRPRNSRQRLDLAELDALEDLAPSDVMQALLGPNGSARLVTRVAAPPEAGEADDPDDDRRTAAHNAWTRQLAVIRKLRHIAEEARTYEEDTGVYVLHVGFPLVHASRAVTGARRVLAPLAFIPVALTVKSGASPAIELACRYEGAERVIPNEALFAWLERQVGADLLSGLEESADADPWDELRAIVTTVATALEIDAPAWCTADAPEGEAATAEPGPQADSETDALALDLNDRPAPDVELTLTRAPGADDAAAQPTIDDAAVLGLFPVSNQGLLHDTQAMMAEGVPAGPVESFLRAEAGVDAAAAPTVERRQRDFSEERFVQAADPCQARAIRLARSEQGLVVHGPPGTGKSQTITNVIADHLSRGERVLFVCDKRTALDVVANRLEHVGLGDLCALIHDPQRDQRTFYLSVREQLEELVETHADARAPVRVESIDAELQKMHGELLDAWTALMVDPAVADDATPNPERAGGPGSFHDLVGRWLEIEPAEELTLAPDTLGALRPDDLEALALDIHDVLARGRDVDHPANPWTDAAGIALESFLATPADPLRERLHTVVDAATAADATIVAGLPAFDPEIDAEDQGDAWAALADRVESLRHTSPLDVRRQWTSAPPAELATATDVVAGAAAAAEAVRGAPEDPEIDLVLREAPASVPALTADLGAVTNYLEAAGRWWGFLARGRAKRARAILERFGLGLSRENAARIENALRIERHRRVLAAAVERLETAPVAASDVRERFDAHAATLELVRALDTEPPLRAVHTEAREVLADARAVEPSVAAWRAAPERARAVAALMRAQHETGLFADAWRDEQRRAAGVHAPARALAQTLVDRFGSLEGVLRLRGALERLPSPLDVTIRRLLDRSADPDAGAAALEHAALAAEIGDRLRAAPSLTRLDGWRVETMLQRMHELQAQKMEQVRHSVRDRWVARQRRRLLVGTGSRLNGLGAEVKRRLLTRGRRAMRLRQVIAHGRDIEDGDPLFDLRPVWMASPETVAQVFPRETIFDVVIFDEASQCRLEEALPVLTRAKRVVIAGDPKQLPPTRFFESTVVATEEPAIETAQDLFEAQQGSIEDLLGAALTLEFEQAYLDVHYRSRNADLIGFSNEFFYSTRLQAIPGHPDNRARFAPITLYRADGVYDQSQNPGEAEKVVEIVRDLLRRGDPPSIGVACFNVVQRDLIQDALEAAAETDADFARRLDVARRRRGEGSFEGLFVKNLENVQGDERDHIIISTTYGPNAEGRFYKRFGPLLRAGGGRRLNVLVTRARDEVHLVTSIPPSEYRALPPIPEGQAPGGAWLLFAYLAYAEQIAEAYEESHAARAAAQEAPVAEVRAFPSRSPSRLAPALAGRLARNGLGSEVHWGNDGFCVDVALDHPERAESVSLGVLTDMTRFRAAADPVEWELFRTLVLRSQGWALRRIWAPHVFRDPQGLARDLRQRADEYAKGHQDPDAMEVWGADEDVHLL